MSAFEVRLWSDGERVSILAKPAARPRVSADLLDSTLSVQDPVGLWEALTDALREDHGEHLAAYLTPPAVPTAPPRGAGVEGPGEAAEASPPARPVDSEPWCMAEGDWGCVCTLPLGHASVHMCAAPDHAGWSA